MTPGGPGLAPARPGCPGTRLVGAVRDWEHAGVKSLGLILTLAVGVVKQRNVRLLLLLVGLFIALVAGYSTVFHVLMDREGQSHSWPTAIYWTLVTMTTLGFGDITFQSDAGRVFSVVVLLTGTLFLLVLLPFTFIQFVFLPWMARREAARAPRSLPEDTSGHLVLTGLGAIEDALIRRADRNGVPYVLLVGDLEEALRLYDRGYRVLVGALDSPNAYRAARVEHADLVAATRSDTTNANIVFTVREISSTVPVVATASRAASVDILSLAGADEVLELGVILGAAMAERILAPDGRSHVIGELAGLLIAEARVAGTALSGRTVGSTELRSRFGVSILGVWAHGEFEIAGPTTRLEENSVVILAATREDLDAYDRVHATGDAGAEQAVIIGGGRVGRAAAAALGASGTRYRIVEERSDRIRDPLTYVLGDAADIDVLEDAGIETASTVLITTHDDDVNIYLALYCRRLRPDVRIVARSNLDRNVSTLYRAGADDVLSYASTGATAIWNRCRGDNALLLAEGLEVFRVAVPPALVGRTIATSGIRHDTGCNVVSIERADRMVGIPTPTEVLVDGANLVLIGDAEAEARFLRRYPPRRRVGRVAPTRVGSTS